MTIEELPTKYSVITTGLLEPGRTIHVLSNQNGDDAKAGEDFSLVEIWAIANPAISDGKVRYHKCQDRTTGIEVFTLPLETFITEKPDSEGFLHRIPR